VKNTTMGILRTAPHYYRCNKCIKFTKFPSLQKPLECLHYSDPKYRTGTRRGWQTCQTNSLNQMFAEENLSCILRRMKIIQFKD
jgi:hypothetical protein